METHYDINFYVIKAAFMSNDEERTYFITEDNYFRWCDCEPLQGYKKFEVLWHGKIDEINLEFKPKWWKDKNDKTRVD